MSALAIVATWALRGSLPKMDEQARARRALETCRTYADHRRFGLPRRA
jgi:hypothetical protein